VEAAMHGKEKRVLLREYLDQGLSKTAIAQKLGIGRRSIHRWIVEGQLDRDLDEEAIHYRARPPVNHKIDPYRGIIEHRLEEFPKLSAVRLYEELRSVGYPGGYP
jgi:transposase